ncbi:ribonuclease Z [Patescibacteria group bacterium]|nr:ribonuclease Z [Patescibacteria group bacterium]
MKQKITLLGTGTCQLQKHRTSSSILVQLEDLLFVYDLGRGTTQRLAELEIKQDDLQHIVVSHFHPDHVSDLVPFLHASCWSQIDPRSKNLHIYGPVGLEEQMGRILNLFGAGGLERDSFKVQLHEIHDTHFAIGKHSFSFINLPPVNNSGLKFEVNGKVYAFTGDSDFHEKEIAFLDGVDFAVIDAGHPMDEQIVDLATKTQVPTIVLSHLYRETDENEIRQKANQAGYKGDLIVGSDLMSFDL